MNTLVHPKETAYFAICCALSALIYTALVVSIFGLAYIVGGVVISLILHGLFTGNLRGNAIRVSDRQFPEIHHLTTELARQMEMDVPVVYVLQSGGLLNAFATRFLGRNFVVLYSDVLEIAYEEGEPAVAFILVHELAHIKRGHLRWRWALYPAMLIPFLGSAYSRACEYTCDRFGAHYRADGAVKGLLVLAAGKKLYRRVDAHDYSFHAEAERGFWVGFSEILSTHPNLPKRVQAVVERGATAATTAQAVPAAAAYALK